MPTARDPKPPKYAFMKKAALALPGTAEVIDRPKGYFPVPALKHIRGPYHDFVRDILEIAAHAFVEKGQSIVYAQYSFAVYALAMGAPNA